MRGGRRDGGHEVSILIRVSDGERSGCVPSKVSTMIILPPQQAHGREGEDVSSRSARERSGERPRARRAIGGRARCCGARTVPAKRP